MRWLVAVITNHVIILIDNVSSFRDHKFVIPLSLTCSLLTDINSD
jgi:hypothetical protein